MDTLQTFELLSYLVTIVALPFAIGVFLFEQRKERENEEEEAYLELAASYTEFLELVLANPELKLRGTTRTLNLTEDQSERMIVILEILISLFERAYILLYEPALTGKALRRWRSWEDYMREWCRREDFRDRLPQLLAGEDAEFATFIRELAASEGQVVLGPVAN